MVLKILITCFFLIFNLPAFADEDASVVPSAKQKNVVESKELGGEAGKKIKEQLDRIPSEEAARMRAEDLVNAVDLMGDLQCVGCTDAQLKHERERRVQEGKPLPEDMITINKDTKLELIDADALNKHRREYDEMVIDVYYDDFEDKVEKKVTDFNKMQQTNQAVGSKHIAKQQLNQNQSTNQTNDENVFVDIFGAALQGMATASKQNMRSRPSSSTSCAKKIFNTPNGCHPGHDEKSHPRGCYCG